jgi:transcriptional regulator with XRE-family HTH domain
VDAKSEIRDFLTSRRARVTPQQVGLRTFGGLRRVPGLRREEVALLAGVSVDYYTRLERGNVAGASDAVLEALARALQLNEVERAHLFALARATHSPTPQRRRRAQPQRLRANVQRMLDAMVGVPAFVRNGRLDILAANQLGRAFYSQHFDSPYQPVNSARFAFLDPRAPNFYLDWESIAKDMVAVLHGEAGRDPSDRDLSELVGQLSTHSEAFRKMWAMHNVRWHDNGVKGIRHPLVGEVTFTYESMNLVADPDLTMFIYTADPGSKSEQAFNLLASWAATPTEDTARAAQQEHERSAAPTHDG